MKAQKDPLIVLPAYDFERTMATIIETIHRYQSQTKSDLLEYDRDEVKSIKEYLNWLWEWTRQQIKYKLDAPLKEEIRTPIRTWYDRKTGVDCEDYCIFLSTILLNSKIKHSLRVADYGGGWSHIYIVVHYANTNIILDAVNPMFDTEKPFVAKKDYPVKPSKGLSGIESFTINQEIERLLDRQTTFNQVQLRYLKNYSGSGGKAKDGATGEGLLYEFYTPDWIAALMWEIATTHGYQGGNVLETSCGTGVFLDTAPDNLNHSFVGFEVNQYSAKIAQLRHPKATIYNQYFETAFLDPQTKFRTPIKLKNKAVTWLKEYPFDLVIGNPPYGIYQNQYSSYFPELKRLGIKQMEIAFMYWGLKMLKTEGLLVYITSQNFMRTGFAYQQAKEAIGQMANLVDAYRLPAVFDSSQVPTDILVFRKK